MRWHGVDIKHSMETAKPLFLHYKLLGCGSVRHFDQTMFSTLLLWVIHGCSDRCHFVKTSFCKVPRIGAPLLATAWYRMSLDCVTDMWNIDPKCTEARYF